MDSLVASLAQAALLELSLKSNNSLGLPLALRVEEHNRAEGLGLLPASRGDGSLRGRRRSSDARFAGSRGRCLGVELRLGAKSSCRETAAEHGASSYG